ncbi:hypothetical protein [Streptomyces sp. NPDC057052]|uniref:hypothetical protein n=1 Tax=Streptomyces sp. NPDC057052 TaxID=3346010 RepID=UPI003633EB85
MTPDQSFTDPSCFHATLATLLLDHDPARPPAAVLGNTTATAAALNADGEAVFGDTVAPLLDALGTRGLRLDHRRLREPGELNAFADAVRTGLPVVTVVDTFHLPHYWVDRGRIHGLHALVLRGYDPADSTVRMTDAVDTTFFDQRVTLASLDAALRDECQMQTWMRPVSWDAGHDPDTRTVAAELAGHAETLAGTAREELSGTALVRALARDVDRLVSPRSARRPPGIGAQTPDTGRMTDVLQGMWSYHHTLRWFGDYLAVLRLPRADAPVREASAAVVRAAHHLLAVRGLMVRCGVSGPARIDVYRTEIARRLDEVGTDLATAASALRRAADAAVRSPEGARR